MKSHIERARANESFLIFIDQNGGDDFVEWKMTVLFYTGLHYLRAFLKFNKIPTPHSHKETDFLINPAYKTAKLPFPQKQYDYYNTLYQNSWEARYSGVYDTTFQELLLKVKYSESIECLEKLKQYFQASGLHL
jgi:hypothetical protein